MISSLITRADQFGVPFKYNIDRATPVIKSVQGGILTLVLYGLALGYSVYYLEKWTSNTLLPKITSSQEVVSKVALSMKNDIVVQFTMRKDSDDINSLDPFNETAIILLPVLYTVINNVPFYYGAFPLIKGKSNITSFNIVELSGLEFTLNLDYDNDNPNVDYMIGFSDCKAELLLDSGQKCAPQEVVSQFFQQKANVVILSTFMKQFNTNTQQLDTIRRDLPVAIENLETFCATQILTLTETNADSGYLFESIQSYTYISNVEFVPQQLSYAYFNKVLGFNFYFMFMCKLNSIIISQSVDYPKINEVLAEIGSIVSAILMLNIIATQFNEHKLQQLCEKAVIEMYYPSLKHVNFAYNIFGQINRITYKNREQDINKFMKYYDRLKLIASNKTTLLTQIYEVSRIQFVLQKLTNSNLIMKTHSEGIRLQEYPILNEVVSPELNELSMVGDSRQIAINNQQYVITQQNGAVFNESFDNELDFCHQETDFQLLDPQSQILETHNSSRRQSVIQNVNANLNIQAIES